MQSLAASSVNVTGISIRWDRVHCQERNGRIDGYRVVYYPTLSSDNDQIARTIAGTEGSDRMFSITGLPPRTNYTFEVQALNFFLATDSVPVVYTTSTTAPQGKCH